MEGKQKRVKRNYNQAFGNEIIYPKNMKKNLKFKMKEIDFIEILEKLKIEEGKKIFIWTYFFEYVNAKILTNLNYVYLKQIEAKPL